jgi:hypothetical protein
MYYLSKLIAGFLLLTSQLKSGRVISTTLLQFGLDKQHSTLVLIINIY